MHSEIELRIASSSQAGKKGKKEKRMETKRVGGREGGARGEGGKKKAVKAARGSDVEARRER
jgi:hypothetical protein